LSDNPLISIIIPTLNEEKLIGKTLSQFTPEFKNYFNAEVIISDGGSSDRTIEIARYFTDKITSISQGEYQNISMGRNQGARIALGRYLYFFNADTLINEPYEFFSETLEVLSRHSYIAVACNVKVFPDEEKLSDILFHGFYNNYVCLLNKLGLGMARGECHIIRSDIFWSVNGYNESLSAGEDFDLYRRIKKFGKIKFLRKLTVFESPRRYRKFGYAKVFLDWTRNSLSVLLLNKSASDHWEAVR
jgi:glycosyltransferase involved in cell wall biosynthesis